MRFGSVGRRVGDGEERLLAIGRKLGCGDGSQVAQVFIGGVVRGGALLGRHGQQGRGKGQDTERRKRRRAKRGKTHDASIHGSIRSTSWSRSNAQRPPLGERPW